MTYLLRVEVSGSEVEGFVYAGERFQSNLVSVCSLGYLIGGIVFRSVGPRSKPPRNSPWGHWPQLGNISCTSCLSTNDFAGYTIFSRSPSAFAFFKPSHIAYERIGFRRESLSECKIPFPVILVLIGRFLVVFYSL